MSVLPPEDTECNLTCSMNVGITQLLLNYRLDGTPFWNLLCIIPLRDERGEITYFIVRFNICDLRGLLIPISSRVGKQMSTEPLTAAGHRACPFSLRTTPLLRPRAATISLPKFKVTHPATPRRRSPPHFIMKTGAHHSLHRPLRSTSPSRHLARPGPSAESPRVDSVVYLDARRFRPRMRSRHSRSCSAERSSTSWSRRHCRCAFTLQYRLTLSSEHPKYQDKIAEFATTYERVLLFRRSGSCSTPTEACPR